MIGPIQQRHTIAKSELGGCTPQHKVVPTKCTQSNMHKQLIGTYNGRGRLDGRLLAVAGGAVIGTYTIVGSLRTKHVDVRVRLTR